MTEKVSPSPDRRVKLVSSDDAFDFHASRFMTREQHIPGFGAVKVAGTRTLRYPEKSMGITWQDGELVRRSSRHFVENGYFDIIALFSDIIVPAADILLPSACQLSLEDQDTQLESVIRYFRKGEAHAAPSLPPTGIALSWQVLPSNVGYRLFLPPERSILDTLRIAVPPESLPRERIIHTLM